MEIDEKFTIDYNEYNRKISKFITVYNLSNTNSTLSVNMYLHVINKYDGSQVNKDEKVMTLNIPLTTKTVDVSIATNVVKGEGKMLIQESQYGDLTYVLITGVSILTIGIIILLMFIKYVLETRSAETMYEQELRKILFNYKSNIQKIDIQKFNKEYPILKIAKTNKFHDRFIVIDNKEMYHLGASIKDLGKKCFGINKIEDMKIIEKFIDINI